MQLSIPIGKPRKTFIIFVFGWLTLGVLAIGSLWYLQPQISSTVQFAILGFWLGAASLNLFLLHTSLDEFQAIYWYESQWYLLTPQGKLAIELEANTRVFTRWILLEYRYLEPLSRKKRQLFLPKDAFNDKDYRDLCRTLRFLSKAKETT